MANDYSFQGRPRNIALQERAVKEAQEKLNRIERMREQMAQQVALEQKRLDEMRRQATDFTRSKADELAQPSASASIPEGFQSQFDRFNTTPSNKRLETIGNEGIDIKIPESPSNPEPTKLAGGAQPTQNQTFYRTSDQDQHWLKLNTDPGTAVYVSGYYYSSGEMSKRYEYQLGSTQLPIAVGDMVMAPVHSQGHGDGKFLAGHDRRFIITDIYSKEKFRPYHDVLW